LKGYAGSNLDCRLWIGRPTLNASEGWWRWVAGAVSHGGARFGLAGVHRTRRTGGQIDRALGLIFLGPKRARGCSWRHVRRRRWICTVAHAGVCTFAQFWAQERWQTVVCACAVHRQGRMGIRWGHAALQRCYHGGAQQEEQDHVVLTEGSN
jgi:hypothetical protein